MIIKPGRVQHAVRIPRRARPRIGEAIAAIAAAVYGPTPGRRRNLERIGFKEFLPSSPVHDHLGGALDIMGAAYSIQDPTTSRRTSSTLAAASDSTLGKRSIQLDGNMR